MNTFVWGYNDEYTEVIDNLEKDGIISPKVWLIDAEEDACRPNQFSVRDFLYKDCWQEVYAKKINEYLDGVKFNDEVYEQVYQKLYRFIDCESRYEKHSIKPIHQYVNKFNMLYRFIYSVFVKENIELCLFSNLTHEGMDVIIFNTAKALGIKTLFLTQSLVPNQFDKVFYMKDVDDYGNFKFMTKIYNDEDIKLEITSTDDLWYMKGSNKMTFKQWRHHLPFYNTKKYGKFREYKKTLNSLIEPVDYSKKYVYFPLHLQPEMTTSCFGGMYCDQLLAIEKLSSILPENCYIYIKENPKQNEKQRDFMFFERLKFIKNIKLVPLDENSEKLAKYSQFVATITGTAGWEAICHNKPALVFGNTWYQNFEGVFKWYNNLTYEEIVNKKIDFDKLQSDYANLISRMPKGVIDHDYVSALPNYNKAESLNNIYCLLKDLIKKEDN